MKKHLAAITAILIATAAAPTAHAQEIRSTDDALVVLAAYLAEQKPEHTTANDFIGQPIVNAAGDEIGDVKNLVISPEGDVVAAVVGVGGFLGIGEKDVALPTESIVVIRLDDSTLRLTTLETAETLKAAPEFKPLAELRAEASDILIDPTTTASITGE
jgi:sporulation protein YlmC with PRC-barrel domain